MEPTDAIMEPTSSIMEPTRSMLTSIGISYLILIVYLITIRENRDDEPDSATGFEQHGGTVWQ